MSYHLIKNRKVIEAMREAYKRSNMGGLKPEAHLPPRDSPNSPSEKIRTLHLKSKHVQVEWCGLILETPKRDLYCKLYSHCIVIPGGGFVSSLPANLKKQLRGRHIGTDAIVGFFHTHPSTNPKQRWGPSDADIEDFKIDPIAPPEEYVIDVYNIWVMHWEGPPNKPAKQKAMLECAGSTGDLLFCKVQPVGPRPDVCKRPQEI
jgi:hypothetical protein